LRLKVATLARRIKVRGKPRPNQETIMAKGEQRSNREAKKPKKNKDKAGATATSFITQPKMTGAPQAKKK